MDKILSVQFDGGYMAKQTKKQQTAELISRVRKGDEEAFSLLLEQYIPLIDASVRKYLTDDLYSLYADDMRQEATMVFYNSILAYDMEQYDVEFGLYAKICITNALISQLRLLNKRKAERLSGTSEDGLFAKCTEEPSVEVLQDEGLRSLYSVIRKNLSDFEYQVFEMNLSGKSTDEIAAIAGKDSKAIDNAIYRIRKKLRALLDPK